MALKTNFEEVRKEVTKGCPQGSVFGPTGWDVVLDSLLLKLERQVVAYADVIIAVVKGNGWIPALS